MILKNLLRRKGRTLLTVFGIALGVAAIIGLGAMANGMEKGYNSMLSGSKADLVLSQPDSFELSYSSVKEEIISEVRSMPEVADASGMIEGYVQTENSPYFFIFGYPKDSFVLDRMQITQGVSLNDSSLRRDRGKPVLMGSAAAESMHKKAGDTLRLGGSVYRIVGIYQTGDAFEDSGAVLPLDEAQVITGKPRQVSLVYIKLKSPNLRSSLENRTYRRWPDLALSTTGELADKQVMDDSLRVYVWVFAGLAIVLGGVGMMNAQLMAVYERTREIGVLRAVGWSQARILRLILGESVLVCLAGGAVGLALGWLAVYGVARSSAMFGTNTAGITPLLIMQALIVVVVMGLAGGLYPAWRGARLQPIEALRYEGGSTGAAAHRLPFGGMAVQSLWQRTTRTLLTVGVIGLTVGSIMLLEGYVKSMSSELGKIALGGNNEIMIRQADIADTSLSAIDEQIGKKIAAMPEIDNISGMVMTAIMLPEGQGFFIAFGYAPQEYAIAHFRVMAGKPLASGGQILLGSRMAQSLKKGVGDTIILSGMRFRVVGIYQSNVSWEELGGVMTLRDAQTFSGRPRKVTIYGVKLRDPSQARVIVDKINTQYPTLHAALSGDFADQMPDLQATNGMMAGISVLAILVGGLGVMNTMLMAVLERTREIGVLRAVGWRRSAVLGLILRESLLLGLLGGLSGLIVALGLSLVVRAIPYYGDILKTSWTPEILARAFLIALTLGAIGGLYPALRATRLQPVEALRYE